MIKEQCAGFLNTPPLWKGKQYGVQQFEFPIIDLHSFIPVPIPDNIRLGHQIEYIFKQLIEFSEKYEMVLYNLQVGSRERTMGEIDFVLNDMARNTFVHIELTYKFYLIIPDHSDPIHQLIGPNKRDSFFKKIQKIKNKQFPLVYSVEGTKAIMDNNIDPSHIDQQCCFKAQLFQPYGESDCVMGEFNKGCIVGYWLRFDFFDHIDFASSQFYIPSKSEWVINPHDQVIWKSRIDIMIEIKEILKQEMAPMLWVRKSESQIEKLFVVWW